MYKSKYILLLLLVPFANKRLCANEFDDLKKFSTLLSSASTYSINISVKIYKQTKDKVPVETFDGELRKQGVYYYSDLMGEVFLQNKNCALQIDKGNKKMVYIKMTDETVEKPKENFDELKVIVDSIQKSRYKLKYVVNNANEKIIAVTTTNKTMYKKMHIWLDPITCVLKKVEYEYVDDSNGTNKGFYERVVISYDSFELNKDLNEEIFSEKKYIDYAGGKVIVSKGYSNYKLINKS